MAFQSSLGIDITAEQVVLVYLKSSFGGVKLGGSKIYPLPEGLQGEERLSAAADCVADFLDQPRIAPEGVFFGLPGELAISRKLEFPLAVKENLRETLRYEMEKYIPIPIEEVTYDYQVIAEDKEAKQLSLLMVVSKIGDIDAYRQLSEKVQIGLSGIETRMAALTNFFALSGHLPRDETIALVFFEKTNLALGLVSKHRLVYSGRHAIGGQGVDTAEVVLSSLQPLKRLANSGDDPLHVWLFGTGLDGATASALENEAGFDTFCPSVDSSGLSSWDIAPAYGLALKGLKKVPMQIDLVPPGLRKKPSRLGYYMMLILALAIFLAGLAWGGGHIMHQQHLQQQLDLEIEMLAAEIKTVDKIQAEALKIEAQIAYLNSLRQGGVAALEVLREITELIPDTAWVRDLTLTGPDLKLDGFAGSASELLPLLDESPLFNEVAFLSAITKGKDGKERFRIGAKVLGE